MISKCIVFNEPHNVGLGEIDVPEPQAGQILARTLYSGVSTGTETRVLRGGEVDTFPLIPGYESVGEVVKVGDGVDMKPGDLVFVGPPEYTGDFVKCWGAHIEYALANADNCIPVPAGTDPVKALYTKVGGIALHGVNRAKITADDKVAIVGLGLIGHLALQSVKARGAWVIGIDKDPERLDIAQKAGADAVLNVKKVDVEKKVKALTNGGVTVAVDVTGVAAAADSTARLVFEKPWDPPYPEPSRVLLLGSYSEPVAFSYHPTLFANEPNIITSRDTTQADMKEMMQLIADGKVDPSVLPAVEYPVDAAPQAYTDLVEKKIMRVYFSWK